MAEEPASLRRAALKIRFADPGTYKSAVCSYLLLALAFLLSGCADFGQAELRHDQLEYSQSLSESTKNQVLVNIVRLRYGDWPVFLNTTQVISGYQLQQNVMASGEGFPRGRANSFIGGSASIQLQQNPTFTFEPVRGQAFAESYLRKLPLDTVFPIADDGLPIDIVLRLTVASINQYPNTNALALNDSAGTSVFLHLLGNLRQLQLRGLLAIKRPTRSAPSEKPKDHEKAGDLAERPLVLTIGQSWNAADSSLVRETRRLLGLEPGQQSAQIIAGRRPEHPGQVAVETRSIIATLAAISFDIDVPPSDVDQGVTVASLNTAGKRPAIMILSASDKPANAFAAGQYRGRWYYIEDSDFQSKIAFSVVQLITSLAESSKMGGAVVTVPAR